MGRVGIRQLHNYASRVVRRARAGQRVVITVDGVPTAQIGPRDDGLSMRTMDDLIAAGQVLPPRTSVPPPPPMPTPTANGESSTEILRHHRDR